MLHCWAGLGVWVHLFLNGKEFANYNDNNKKEFSRSADRYLGIFYVKYMQWLIQCKNIYISGRVLISFLSCGFIIISWFSFSYWIFLEGEQQYSLNRKKVNLHFIYYFTRYFLLYIIISGRNLFWITHPTR